MRVVLLSILSKEKVEQVYYLSVRRFYMKLDKIIITEIFFLDEISIVEYGQMAGYVKAILKDDTSNYEVLYRIHDKSFGEDYKIFNIQYDWNLDNRHIYHLIEERLTEAVKNLSFDFDKIEKEQRAWEDWFLQEKRINK